MASFPCNRMAPYPIHGIGLSHHPSYDMLGPLASNYGECCFARNELNCVRIFFSQCCMFLPNNDNRAYVMNSACVHLNNGTMQNNVLCYV